MKETDKSLFISNEAAELSVDARESSCAESETRIYAEPGIWAILRSAFYAHWSRWT